jgi:hypothetical protein
MNRKLLLIAFTISVALVVTACSSGSKSTPTTPPTIAISTPPPTSMQVSATATIAATTTNDNGAGVDWSCTPAGSCGTFSMAHTDSAATTVYTAPSSPGSITITAASTKDPSITAMSTVTINPAAVALTGPYTFYLNGRDAAEQPYGIAGNVVFDGSGNITGGEQDYFDTNNAGTIFSDDPIKPATAAVVFDATGHGTITLTPTAAPVETLSVTVVNNNHLLISEFDTNATSAGALDLQTAPSSVPTGGNAFTFFHESFDVVLGGVLTSDGVSALSPGECDLDFEGILAIDQPVSGTFTPPDASGRGTMTIAGPSFAPFQFAYYVVGPEVFRLVGTNVGSSAIGSMYGQGSATPNFSAASLSGSFVFGQSGLSDSGPGFAMAGQFTTNSTTGVLSAGVADVNQDDGMPAAAGDLTGSTYMVKADGYGGIALPGTTTDGLANFGVYLVDPALNIADPNSTTGGGGALMLDLDTNTFGTGFLVPQSSGATFAGNYAFIQDGFTLSATAFAPFDLIGQVVSDGTSSFSGLADFNDVTLTGLHPGVTLSGTFAADTANPGRSTAQLTVNGGATPHNLTLYQASSALIVHVDMSNSAAFIGTVALGVFEQQQ